MTFIAGSLLMAHHTSPSRLFCLEFMIFDKIEGVVEEAVGKRIIFRFMTVRTHGPTLSHDILRMPKRQIVHDFKGCAGSNIDDQHCQIEHQNYFFEHHLAPSQRAKRKVVTAINRKSSSK